MDRKSSRNVFTGPFESLNAHMHNGRFHVVEKKTTFTEL